MIEKVLERLAGKLKDKCLTSDEMREFPHQHYDEYNEILRDVVNKVAAESGEDADELFEKCQDEYEFEIEDMIDELADELEVQELEVEEEEFDRELEELEKEGDGYE